MVRRETMKKEAIKRMTYLEMHENVVDEFVEENKLNLSEGLGYLFHLDEEQEKLVRDWEKESGNMAYHVIRNNTEFGELLAILYVSKYKEDWATEWKYLVNDTTLSYVINLDDSFCSEYGSIGIKRSIGGLVRTY